MTVSSSKICNHFTIQSLFKTHNSKRSFRYESVSRARTHKVSVVDGIVNRTQKFKPEVHILQNLSHFGGLALRCRSVLWTAKRHNSKRSFWLTVWLLLMSTRKLKTISIWTCNISVRSSPHEFCMSGTNSNSFSNAKFLEEHPLDVCSILKLFSNKKTCILISSRVACNFWRTICWQKQMFKFTQRFYSQKKKGSIVKSTLSKKRQHVEKKFAIRCMTSISSDLTRFVGWCSVFKHFGSLQAARLFKRNGVHNIQNFTSSILHP